MYVIFWIQLKPAKITGDAVTFIFSRAIYLSNPIKKRKLPAKRILCSTINEVNINN